MEITQQVREMAATDPQQGMAQKAAEFRETGGEIYR
jgi:hypothetical protein